VSIYRFIAAERASYRVSLMCELLGVSRSGFYAWQRRPVCERAREDERLLELIRSIHEEARGVYGVRRVHAELRLAHEIRVSRKRVERLMRGAGISGLIRRAIVGWSMGANMRAELVVDALEMALARRRPEPGLIHHSDHGSQYVSLIFGQHDASSQARCSTTSRRSTTTAAGTRRSAISHRDNTNATPATRSIYNQQLPTKTVHKTGDTPVHPFIHFSPLLLFPVPSLF
jgi:hypothetical protein